MSDDNYSLDLGFDTDSPEFCRGFEAADVYHAVRDFAESCEDEHVQTVHATNAEMMLRIAERFGVEVRSEEVGDGWLHVYFSKEATA